MTSEKLSASIFTEPSKVGRYDLIYRIGSGGMAAVFAGRLSGLAGFEKLVAIKVIHKHLADSQRFVDMFLDEARVAASIHHPNVSEIYEVGKDKDLFFMVGEFVHGQDMGKILRRADERQKKLSHGMLSQVGAHVCFGLHAAHETQDKDGNPLNLIHRDISPNNILISYNGFVKIIDFGVAWASNRLAHTESGALKGKVGYVAPEQITGQTLDRRSDIFSAGVMQYIMATMTHPFPGDSDAERLQKIVTGDARPPREVNPDIPVELERIIMKAMSTSPDDRYDTAARMGHDLESFAESTLDAIKTEDRSKVMLDLFESEAREHQTRLNLYRESNPHNDGENGEYGEEAYTLKNSSQEALNDVLVNAAVKKATWRNMWIFSALALMVLILAVAVFFLYKDKVEKEITGQPSKMSIEEQPKTSGKNQASPDNNPPISDETAGASRRDAPVMPTHPNGNPSYEASDAETQSGIADETTTPSGKGSAARKKRGGPKKSGPALLQNPYSPQ